MSPADPQALDALAARYDIAADYVDIFGQHHVTSADTKRAILSAMGVPVSTDDDVRRAIADWDRAVWQRPCEPVLVMPEEDARTWLFRLPIESGEADIRIAWEIRNEHGMVLAHGEAGPGLPVRESRALLGVRYVALEVPPPPRLPAGYYELHARTVSVPDGIPGASALIIVPAHGYVPPALARGERTWGIAVQLYGLRSGRNWGVGDLGDLERFVQWAANDLGAGIVGLNPLHALRNERPYHISPYSPDSRLFLNPLYIDIDAVPEFGRTSERPQADEVPDRGAAIQTARASELVQYDLVHEAKLNALQRCFDAFSKHDLDECGTPCTPRGRLFAAFVQTEGEPLERYAVFQVLRQHFARQPAYSGSWLDWPEPYRHPSRPEVAIFHAQHRAEVRFHQYVQWIAAEQMSGAVQRTRDHGMAIGLYHDLALGSDRSGSDAWVFQDVLALDADCGAPPDAFAPEGQNWGLPPVNPHRLRDDRYRMYTAMLRQTLRRGGALRIDHVMALFRLFWIPRGMPASAGTYVAYPWEDLLGILALESQRQRVVIVGEDLGTVPNYVREELGKRRVLSYRVSYFERWDNGEWKPPAAYPAQALAVVSTHDLPTLAGFWSGHDIETRVKLGLYRSEHEIQQAWEERRRDKDRMIRALQHEQILPADPPARWAESSMLPAEVWRGIHLYLARTPSMMMLAGLEDLIMDREQANLPGTVDEHPNWMRKSALSLEELIRDPRPRELSDLIGPLRQARAEGEA